MHEYVNVGMLTKLSTPTGKASRRESSAPGRAVGADEAGIIADNGIYKKVSQKQCV